MAGKYEERDNYFRICILVVEHIKHALVDMLIYYLYVCQNDMSFEKFIDVHMTEIKYLRKSKILYQEEVDKFVVDDNAISSITVDALEVTLVRRLLDNLCPELFMDDGSKTLQDFLKKNHHDIYHLFKWNQRCCQCTDHYQRPVGEALLKENQYKNMFESSPCANCTGTRGAVCSALPCKDTPYIQLDYGTRCKVFGHFSIISKAMQNLKKIRDIAYGHKDAAVMSKALYDDHKKNIEDNIMVLARISGNEDKTRLALDNVQTCSYNENLYNQLKDSLTLQVQRDIEVMEAMGEHRQMLQEVNQKVQESIQIIQKLPQQFQEIIEEVRNLKTTETKDNQAGVMTSCCPESSSNNISTGNDQRGQGNQSSIDTDAEPCISSVNNDLDNKRDGVVLHVDDDTVAAKEFIKNMKRENPDLNIDIISYEELLPGTSRLRSAANIFLSYIYLFVFETQNLKKISFEMYITEIAMVEILKKFEKQGRIIPVAVERDITFDHPILAPLIPLKYHNYLEATISQKVPDQDFNKCFRDLIIKGRQKHRVG